MDFDYEKELQLLQEYIDIYIQLLPYCFQFGGYNIDKSQLPTFEEYKEDIEWFKQPSFKQAMIIWDKTITTYSCAGLGVDDYAGYRFIKSYKGCQIFMPGNIYGEFTIKEDYINEKLKLIGRRLL